MTIEKFEKIEALVKQHQALSEIHDYVIKMILDLERTQLPGQTFDQRKDLVNSLYKTIELHFHPLKQAVLDQLDAVK